MSFSTKPVSWQNCSNFRKMLESRGGRSQTLQSLGVKVRPLATFCGQRLLGASLGSPNQSFTKPATFPFLTGLQAGEKRGISQTKISLDFSKEFDNLCTRMARWRDSGVDLYLLEHFPQGTSPAGWISARPKGRQSGRLPSAIYGLSSPKFQWWMKAHKTRLAKQQVWQSWERSLIH